MEFATKGTLQDFLAKQDPSNPLDPKTVLKILIGVARGLAYIHGQTPMPILHRDIKSENVLLTDDLTAKLADLGEARAMAENGAMTQVSRIGPTSHRKTERK